MLPFIEKKVKGRPWPWLNKTLKSKMNERDNLLRKAKKSNPESDSVKFKMFFK